ncbi:proteasome subunit alpha type-2-like isoform X3 [Dioscorea cayenensis subsp. rotundata]|uniref:Proteasome subunit alpha type-2-like isoform X3 n=1 Tax=Dioscorea cayennensis subsp. rotundata TaxID=55577 RepID=A0AB40C6H1_DIOCR|nr:proteasome subunit alpha type-2-like isoform X3 [Dioscorea cayenensis subsp. rotundata]
MDDSQYSFSLTTCSPSGKLVQIEHALMAVGSGQTSIGIKAANGVVIATEKKLSSILVDETSVQKSQLMTTNVGVVYSGMGPDFWVLVRKSRKRAQRYYRLYKVDPSGSYFSWKTSVMGKNVSNAKTFLEKRYTDDMELDDAVHTAILTLKEGYFIRWTAQLSLIT